MIGRALNSPGDVAMRRFKLFGTNERKSVRRTAPVGSGPTRPGSSLWRKSWTCSQSGCWLAA